MLCQVKDIEPETTWNKGNINTKTCLQRDELKFIKNKSSSAQKLFKMKNMIALWILKDGSGWKVTRFSLS